MRILEVGNYIIPAYAGMVLAEQGHDVLKWCGKGPDPIQELTGGAALWDWINHGKRLMVRDVAGLLEDDWSADIIIDNLRPSALARRGIVPEAIAAERGIRWVSVRADVGDTSFDIIAQARSWMEYGPWVPFYVGDTVAGLWLAFKAVASVDPGHYVLGHATLLQKLVEGELSPRPPGPVPWDPPGTYRFEGGNAEVEYRGRQYREPVRTRDWKLANLWVDHGTGRLKV